MAKKEDATTVKDEELESDEDKTEEPKGSEEEDVDATEEEPSRLDLMGQMIDATVTGDEEEAKASFSQHATGVMKTLLNPEPEASEEEEGAEDSEGSEESDSEGTEEDKDD